jgi:stage IV sporulation protein FB
VFLADPPPNPWDLRFQIVGTPVRITPWFWLASALLGWSFASSIGNDPRFNLNVGVALLMWIAVVLVSILVHEFGHALAFRFYGIQSHIVLYHFGGFAAPYSTSQFGRQMRLSPKQHIVVSAAGPAASLALGSIVAAIFFLRGYVVPNPLPFIPQLDFLENGHRLPSLRVLALLDAILFVNIGWAVMNLLPVYPLDGGQISREVFILTTPREGIRYSLVLSMVAAGAVAVWALSRQDTYLAIMFGMLAFSSYQTMQAYFGRGGGFGGGQW